MASARARPVSGVVTAVGGPMIFLIMALKSALSSAIARLVRSSSRSSLLSPTNTPVFSTPSMTLQTQLCAGLHRTRASCVLPAPRLAQLLCWVF